MVRFPDVKISPSTHDKEKYGRYKRIPGDAVFVCSYFVFMNPIEFGESAFIRRADGEDELWVADFDVEINDEYKSIDLSKSESFAKFSCAVSAPSEGDILAASKTLLTHLFRSRVGYNFPSEFIREGLISNADYNDVVQSLKAELDNNAKLARALESDIIKTAEELRLNPRPDGRSPKAWVASCPTHSSHPIYINAESDTFGCPWCRRKGGVEELRAFYKERQDKKAKKSLMKT